MKIILFTASYPYGSGEAFIETELDVISKHVEHIYLVPMNIQGAARPIDYMNVRVIDIHSYDIRNSKVNLSFFEKTRILLTEWFRSNTSLKFIRYDLKLLRNSESVAKKLSIWLRNTDVKDGVFYSYWFDEWTSALAILKMNGLVSSYISRAHGFDLYCERHLRNQIPLRFFHFKHIDRVFVISKEGQHYLEHKFPEYNGKIDLSYLGTLDYGLGIRPIPNDIHIVSCSVVKPIKRVSAIFKIIEGIPNAHWTHIGAGEEFEELREQVNNSEHCSRVTLKGAMNHNEVMGFYAKNAITCFINLSESEGLPVSIMEAISFGIPIIATNVGGASEIVTEQTGLLLPAYPQIDEARQSLISLLHQINKGFFPSQTIRDFWKIHFDAKINYRNFIDQLV